MALDNSSFIPASITLFIQQIVFCDDIFRQVRHLQALFLVEIEVSYT
jgi:hypothetical protein